MAFWSGTGGLAVSPMMVAAPSTPQPGRAGRLGGQVAHPAAQRAFQRVDLNRELAAAGQEFPCDAGDHAIERVQPRGQVVDDAAAAQAAGGNLQRG